MPRICYGKVKGGIPQSNIASVQLTDQKLLILGRHGSPGRQDCPRSGCPSYNNQFAQTCHCHQIRNWRWGAWRKNFRGRVALERQRQVWLWTGAELVIRVILQVAAIVLERHTWNSRAIHRSCGGRGSCSCRSGRRPKPVIDPRNDLPINGRSHPDSGWGGSRRASSLVSEPVILPRNKLTINRSRNLSEMISNYSDGNRKHESAVR